MTIPAALLSHIQSPIVTIAWCWKVTRLDGQIFGFTTHVTDLTFGGLTYKAASGFMASSIDNLDTLAVDNFQIQGVLDSATITASDLQAGRWDAAALEISFVNYMDLTMGSSRRFVGTIGNVQTGRIGFTADQRGLTQPLSQNIGRIVSNQCDAILGDSKCGVNLATYQVTGTVGASPTSRSFTDTARSEAVAWFDGGNLTMTSGLSSGLKMEVKHSAGNAIELVLPMFFGIAAGDTYTMTPGCNHLLKMGDGTYTGDCKIKFNNVLKGRMFSEVPGTDRILMIGGRSSTKYAIGTSTVPGAPASAPIAPTPPDVLTNLMLDINPTGLADFSAIVDSSASPATITGTAAIVGGLLRFNSGDFISAANADAKFNLGSGDFSLAWSLTTSATPPVSSSAAHPSQGLFTRGGTYAGSMAIYMTLTRSNTGAETADSGTVYVYLADLAGSGPILKSAAHMNDGVSRNYRFTRVGKVFYLIVNGVVVDSFDAGSVITITALTGEPLYLGDRNTSPLVGTMGRVTLKK